MKKLLTFLKLYWSLFRDPRTPTRSKILPWLGLLYLIVPIDIVPDFIPLLGQLDDIGIIVLFLYIAMNAISDSLYKEHVQKRQEIIDIEPKSSQKP